MPLGRAMALKAPPGSASVCKYVCMFVCTYVHSADFTSHRIAFTAAHRCVAPLTAPSLLLCFVCDVVVPTGWRCQRPV